MVEAAYGNIQCSPLIQLQCSQGNIERCGNIHSCPLFTTFTTPLLDLFYLVNTKTGEKTTNLNTPYSNFLRIKAFIPALYNYHSIIESEINSQANIEFHGHFVLMHTKIKGNKQLPMVHFQGFDLIESTFAFCWSNLNLPPCALHCQRVTDFEMTGNLILHIHCFWTHLFSFTDTYIYNIKNNTLNFSIFTK